MKYKSTFSLALTIALLQSGGALANGKPQATGMDCWLHTPDWGFVSPTAMQVNIHVQGTGLAIAPSVIGMVVSSCVPQSRTTPTTEIVTPCRNNFHAPAYRSIH